MPKVQKSRLSATNPGAISRKSAKEGKRIPAKKAPKKTKKTTARQSTESNIGAESTAIRDESIEVSQEQTTQPAKKPYTYLTAHTRRIPQDIVASEWVALPVAARQRVKDLLTTAKRTVVSCTRSQKRNEEAEAVIAVLMSNLTNRLPRMPFPPNSKELNFDLEKLLERGRLLEGQLTTAVHSLGLLTAELQKEERQLDRDREQLARLKKDAKSQSKLWDRQQKTMHPLLQLQSINTALSDGPEDIGLAFDSVDDDAIFDTEDSDLAPVLTQLTSHLESIHANSQQVHGIEDGIASTRAALEGVLRQQTRRVRSLGQI